MTTGAISALDVAETPTCRHCGAFLTHTLVDLGLSPLANSFLEKGTRSEEPYYPLRVCVCDECLLVQVDNVVPASEIFTENYAYFSSYSDAWLRHCARYADTMIERFGLNSDSLVVEIASNDGYLLQYFQQEGVPVLGIEPAANCAAEAERKGVRTRIAFFSQALALSLRAEGFAPNLICSANVLAHVPEINDFVAGVRELLSGDAVYTVEFPHLVKMIQDVQFDTIYHEHYSYLSLIAIERIFESEGLRVFDVDEVPTHGGSLRVYGCLKNASHRETPAVEAVRVSERAARLDRPEGYDGFQVQVEQACVGLMSYLNEAKAAGRTVVGYGAAAKGNTLLNYCGIGTDLISYVVDRNPAKIGMLLPGSRIPVLPVDALRDSPPDDVLILPWNHSSEVVEQLADLVAKGVRFVTAIPKIAFIA